MTRQPQQPQVFKARETFTRDRLKLKPATPKAWSHDAELASWKGKKVHLFTLDGSVLSGTLLDADRYALKISIEAVDGDSVVGNDQSELIDKRTTIFKHALASFVLAE